VSTDIIERGRWYPEMPPALPGETADQYTDRLIGADGTDRRPYDHPRNRQCSIGWHDECSDPDGERCKCPCHTPEGRALEPFAQMTRVDFDEHENPATLHLLVDEKVATRVRASFDLPFTIAVAPDRYPVVLSIGAAADMARHFGQVVGLDPERSAFWTAINNICCAFYENGYHDAPSAGLVPR